MEKGFIDRFEGDKAVIEINGSTRDYPRRGLPAWAKPGDAVMIDDDGIIRPDPESTAKRKREIQELMDELFE